MKTCPVCKANCFDDMEICFGCLHSFARDAERQPSGPLHARTPVLESSLEDDLEPDEAVLPARRQAGASVPECVAPSSVGQDLSPAVPSPSASLALAGAAQGGPYSIGIAPGISMDVPDGFRLVLRFEPTANR